MAETRYFEVQKDTSLPRAFRAVRDNSGTVYDYETEGVAYSAGQVVSSDNIDPRVLERLDDGDDHLNSLLKEVDESAVDEYDAQVRAENELLRIPEHTVEAYVLASDPEEPFQLVNVDEIEEDLQAADEEAKEAQANAKEEAGDEVEPVDEEDALDAIDFAVAKGTADKKAGKAKNVTQQVQDGELEEVVKDSKDSKPKKGQAKSVPTPAVARKAKADDGADSAKEDN